MKSNKALRILCLLLCAAVLAGTLSACASRDKTEKTDPNVTPEDTGSNENPATTPGDTGPIADPAPTPGDTGANESPDFAPGDWFYSAVEYVLVNGLMDTDADGRFRPTENADRAAIITALYRLDGSLSVRLEVPFDDVEDQDLPAVSWGYNCGIIDGSTDSVFGPGNPVSLQDMAVMLYRYAAYKGRNIIESGDLSDLPNWEKVKDYARPAMAWAMGEGYIQVGTDPFTDPEGLIDRASLATLLMRITGGKPVSEYARALSLGLVPDGWREDMSAQADFAGFDGVLLRMQELVDPGSGARYRENVFSDSFPDRGMNRDDGLFMLMLAAEAADLNVYNARDMGFCTEYLVDYDRMFDQYSWDYPYLDMERGISLYFEDGGPDGDPSPVYDYARFWLQRRMDLNNRLHFLSPDENLDFHFDRPLTRADAVSAAVRLYNSAVQDYDPLSVVRVPDSRDREILANAEAAKAAILSNTDELTCEGTAYYVSNGGDDRADGRTPETAWATLEKVNSAKLQPGDGVYFERGGLWRGQLWAQKGVIYSAYGEGEKPKLYASPENGAGAEKWSLLEGTDNIWVYYADMEDCGGLSFNNDAAWGIKVVPAYMDGYKSTIHEGQPFDVREELTEDLMFFSEADSILYDGAPFRYTVMDSNDRGIYPDVVGKLYLRCDRGNPGEVFDSIEFLIREGNVLPEDGCVFHNLCLKYSGDSGIYGWGISYDVAYCEIGWIGGSIQYYRYDDGVAVRAGNGAECDGSYDHFSVKNCYIYECWDAGVSNQDPAELPDVTGDEDWEIFDAVQRNITYSGNVFERCDMPVEIFFTLEDGAGYGEHRMENVLISENYILYTGFGWGSIQDAKPWFSSPYMGHRWPNASKDLRIEDNVFYLSTGPLLMPGSMARWNPVLSGNTYVQTRGNALAVWAVEDGNPVTYAAQPDTAEDVVRDILGDITGTVIVD